MANLFKTAHPQLVIEKPPRPTREYDFREHESPSDVFQPYIWEIDTDPTDDEDEFESGTAGKLAIINAQDRAAAQRHNLVIPPAVIAAAAAAGVQQPTVRTERLTSPVAPPRQHLPKQD